MRLCLAKRDSKKNGNKAPLSKLGEARDERLMKGFEGVDAESKKFASGYGWLFGRRGRAEGTKERAGLVASDFALARSESALYHVI
jgi:hypothetical protein